MIAPTNKGVPNPTSSARLPMIKAPSAGPPRPMTSHTLITRPRKRSSTDDCTKVWVPVPVQA